jgi:hypothetical protein
VTHARDIWWTLDSANAFVSPGVNSRGELVPSHGASRRRLGDKIDYYNNNNNNVSLKQNKKFIPNGRGANEMFIKKKLPMRGTSANIRDSVNNSYK